MLGLKNIEHSLLLLFEKALAKLVSSFKSTGMKGAPVGLRFPVVNKQLKVRHPVGIGSKSIHWRVTVVTESTKLSSCFSRQREM